MSGKTYRVQYVCPAGSSHMVWVQWHTPCTPQDIAIRVSDDSTITASIQEVPDVEPPDPGFYDTHPGFKLQSVPDWGSQTTAAWSEWVPIWHPPMSRDGKELLILLLVFACLALAISILGVANRSMKLHTMASELMRYTEVRGVRWTPPLTESWTA